MNERTPTALVLSLTLGLFVTWAACTDGAQELVSRSSKIQKGMRVEEVTKILGTPTFRGIIESSKIPQGWDEAWRTSYEEMLKKHDRLIYYNYKRGVVHINVCFDLKEQRTIYVSRFYSTE
jgi:hypothetical protein